MRDPECRSHRRATTSMAAMGSPPPSAPLGSYAKLTTTEKRKSAYYYNIPPFEKIKVRNKKLAAVGVGGGMDGALANMGTDRVRVEGKVRESDESPLNPRDFHGSPGSSPPCGQRCLLLTS